MQLSGLAYGGSCVGAVVAGEESSIGKKAFVPWSVPGETVEADIVSEEKRFLSCELVAVEAPSPDRASPPCPLFKRCGGCQLQHIEGRAQRNYRRRMVEDTLRFQGRIEVAGGVRLIGEELPYYNYRRRIGLHIAESGDAGFYRAGSGEVVDMPYCYLATAAINRELERVRPIIKRHASCLAGAILEEHGDRTFCVLKLRRDLPDAVRSELLAAIPNLEISREGESVHMQVDSEPLGDPELYPAGHFSQVNEAGNEILSAQVLAEIDSDRVTELYAGAGNFSLPLAERGAKVRAVELDSSLVAIGRAAAEKRGLTVEFFNESCESFAKRRPFDPCVVLDPPRSGIRALIPKLLAPGTRKIVYVSCNLPSLSRDLGQLVQGGFRLDRVYVIDMFPQTFHTESVAVLSRA